MGSHQPKMAVQVLDEKLSHFSFSQRILKDQNDLAFILMPSRDDGYPIDENLSHRLIKPKLNVT